MNKAFKSVISFVVASFLMVGSAKPVAVCIDNLADPKDADHRIAKIAVWTTDYIGVESYRFLYFVSNIAFRGDREHLPVGVKCWNLPGQASIDGIAVSDWYDNPKSLAWAHVHTPRAWLLEHPEDATERATMRAVGWDMIVARESTLNYASVEVGPSKCDSSGQPCAKPSITGCKR